MNHLRRLREQRGQSIIILAFAFLGLIAMLGLALDLGLVYIERVRVSRTTDAASLASVVELPFEEEAMQRAIEYIELNGYQVGVDTEVRIRGCIVDPDDDNLKNVGEDGKYDPDDPVDIEPPNPLAGYVYRPVAGDDPPRAVFVIDTMAYQTVDRDDGGVVETDNGEMCNTDLYGTANKLRVTGEVAVDMNFMQFFGFSEVPVSDQALAENVTNLDVVVVFDVSGSMQFETNCFGCWNKIDPDSFDYPNNGSFNPLDYETFDIFWDGGVSNHQICREAPASTPIDTYHYLVHEAEFYSRDVPLHGWEFDKRNAGQGFWVLQRMGKGSNNAHIRSHPFPTYGQGDVNNYPRLQGAAYNGECFDGADLSGQCWKIKAQGLGEPAPSEVPWVEYDFTPDWSGETHIWIRAIGGSDHSWEWNGVGSTNHVEWRESIYWQVDNNSVRGGPFNNLKDGARSSVNNNDWRWVKLGSMNTGAANQSHVFKLYQGSSGFNVDKIIFTDNDGGEVGTAVSKNGCEAGCNLMNNDLTSVLRSNSGEGPDATKGSATREACNKCNPAFGQIVDPADCTCRTGPGDTATGTGSWCTKVLTTTNMLQNDLFQGENDPLRSAKEAVKNFAKRLDPKFDQLGFVAYSNNIVAPRVKLQCLNYAQKALGNSALCYDPATNPISYTHVMRAVEEHVPLVSTNIAKGMREGLEELGIEVPGNTGINHDCTIVNNWNNYEQGDKEVCDRRGAARRVVILLTDGSPNRSVGCPTDYKWEGVYGQGNRAYDCAMYFAFQAADNNVTVYTIGIGSGVNIDLLTAMAEGTDPTAGTIYFEGEGGRYYPAAKPSDLDAIFEDILGNILVRIVG